MLGAGISNDTGITFKSNKKLNWNSLKSGYTFLYWKKVCENFEIKSEQTEKDKKNVWKFAKELKPF